MTDPTDDTTAHQLYRCRACGAEKRLWGVSPTTGPATLRTGCSACDRIAGHVAAGREGPRL